MQIGLCGLSDTTHLLWHSWLTTSHLPLVTIYRWEWSISATLNHLSKSFHWKWPSTAHYLCKNDVMPLSIIPSRDTQMQCKYRQTHTHTHTSGHTYKESYLEKKEWYGSWRFSNLIVFVVSMFVCLFVFMDSAVMAVEIGLSIWILSYFYFPTGT